MIQKIYFPQVSETSDSGLINSWNFSEGQPIQKGDDLINIESDKATLEIESPISGFVRKIFYEEGSRCRTGDLIAIISTTADEEISIPKNQEITQKNNQPSERQTRLLDQMTKIRESDSAHPFISPFARKLIEEHHLDIQGIKGSGPRGRITRDDILPLINIKTKQVKNLTQTAAIPLSETMRRASDIVTESKRTIPHAYVQKELDASRAITWIDQHNSVEEAGKTRISITDLLIKSAALALKDFPLLNSSFSNDSIYLWEEINIGLVVSLGEKGLIVPVIKNADQKTVVEISKSKTDLLGMISRQKINPRDLEGGTFSISNLGMHGADAIIPVIYANQCAILGVGQVKKKPVYLDNDLISANLLWATLCFDHRGVYGETAARFLCRMDEILADPESLAEGVEE